MHDANDLRAFARRNWAAIERVKRSTWQRDKSELGSVFALSTAYELFRHVQNLKPTWPSEADRQADHAVHLRVFDALRRVPAKRR